MCISDSRRPIFVFTCPISFHLQKFPINLHKPKRLEVPPVVPPRYNEILEYYSGLFSTYPYLLTEKSHYSILTRYLISVLMPTSDMF